MTLLKYVFEPMLLLILMGAVSASGLMHRDLDLKFGSLVQRGFPEFIIQVLETDYWCELILGVRTLFYLLIMGQLIFLSLRAMVTLVLGLTRRPLYLNLM